MNKEPRTIPVTDRPTEMWIKIVGIVTLFTFPLLGALGSMAVYELSQINRALDGVQAYILMATQERERISGKVTRLEGDFTSLKGVVSSNTDSIIILRQRK